MKFRCVPLIIKRKMDENVAYYLRKNKTLFKDKFRGCLVGALIGDCLGSLFEGSSLVDRGRLKRHFDRAENNEGTNIRLTDDTQMTQELADSLVQKDGFDADDIARRFTTRYYYDGENAGYGYNVVEVFAKLRDSNFSDPLRPAREQFGGTGSYGNGAAMRVAPVALWGFPSFQRTSQVAEQSATVTHTHVNGRHGAVFQALALRWALLLSPLESTSPLPILALIEEDVMQFKICDTYVEKIKIIKKLLAKERVSDSEVEDKLGTGVAALQSVPTSLFCFLRCLNPIPELPSVSGFRRTVEYAISLGGDTDTIASMAGALAGAFYGLAGIERNTMNSCPDCDRAISQADDLYSIAMSKAEVA